MTSNTSNQAAEMPTLAISTNHRADPLSLTSSPDTCTSTASGETGLRRLSTTDSSVNNDVVYLGANNTTESCFNEGIIKIRELDIELVKEVQNEDIPITTDATTINPTADPYHHFECGFGYMPKLDDPAEIPSNKNEFLEAVTREIKDISFVQNGLRSYLKAINSGQYHKFDDKFLRNQSNAANMTIGQLFQISCNLQDVVTEVGIVDDNSDKVKAELMQAFAHAQPWIQRYRAILVSAHVFYKVNYVLSSNSAQHMQ